MPDDIYAKSLELARQAGIPGGTTDQAQTQPQSAWRQYAPDVAKYAALGAIGSQGGTAGAIGAAAVAALLAAQKKRGIRTPPFVRPGSLGASIGQVDTPDYGGGWGGIDIGAAEGYKKGGGVRNNFGGEISESLMKKPRMTKPHVPADSQSLTARARTTAPPRVTPPAAAPFRASGTGRFAKGGLIRGMGAAVRGCNFKGEC